MNCLRTKFHVSSSSVPLIIVIKPETNKKMEDVVLYKFYTF
jgi:hypothetical protein